MSGSRGAKTLTVSDLTTQFETPQGSIQPVDHVAFTVAPGEILGLVGESGSGKSMTLRSILRLTQAPARVTGCVTWGSEDLLTLDAARLRAIRGREIAMIFQEPMTALNPVLTVHRQIDESLNAHTDLGARARRNRATELLDLVGIPAAASRLESYPHQFSGGMRQRVMIAIAIAADPHLLLADEPTTALDVTIQDQVLKLLLGLRDRLGMSMVLVTHDLGVVAQTCDRVAVMYAGRLVETGAVADVFRTPHHPYTRGLLGSVPQGGNERRPLLSIEGLPPSLTAMPPGCAFYPRCAFGTEVCLSASPPLVLIGLDRRVACHHHETVAAERRLVA